MKLVIARWPFLPILTLCFCVMPVAYAHVSEQGIVLLLPTDIYIFSGCLAVVASMLIASLLPHKIVFEIFEPVRFPLPGFDLVLRNQAVTNTLSLFSLAVILGLVVIGAVGTRDPLTNLLPLTIWTFWWIAVFMAHCLLGNLWRWMNPWTGLYNLMFKDPHGKLNLPEKFGQWPAIFLFIAFYTFIIADIAPDDPARLSNVVLGYLVFNFAGMIVFDSRRWLAQVECFTVLFGLISRLSPVEIEPKSRNWLIGLPGWKALKSEKYSLTQAFFLLTMLASGSFDGVNETFWWLAVNGINPLAFPGRSAVVLPSTAGMLGANALLYLVFAMSVLLGALLVSGSRSGSATAGLPDISFSAMFKLLSITVLPITAVYHGSHYLTSFMINGQYLVAALSDPLADGSNLLGLENYQVTTGYLNDVASVRRIWLSQAGLIVFGHVTGVLMAHFLIAKSFPVRKEALMFHIPFAVFMAGYTWFGLWLLAAPKGA